MLRGRWMREEEADEPHQGLRLIACGRRERKGFVVGGRIELLLMPRAAGENEEPQTIQTER